MRRAPSRVARGMVALATPLALLVPMAPAVTAAPQPAAPAMTRVIVQFAGSPAMSGASGLASASAATRTDAATRVRRQAAALGAEHASFAQRLSGAGIHAKVTRDFSHLVNAAAVSVESSDVARLRAMPGVAAVYPDVTMHTSVDVDVSQINAPQVWATHDTKGVAVQGSGEIIAVVDTGIDYDHPDLGGGFGRGHKVVAGYDFADSDPDPMDDNGHGTHVAGIIAGSAAEPGGRTGVAPAATLTAYKVFDASGNGPESTVIAGLEAAVSVDNPNRADVVNMSLSGPPSENDPLDQASEDAIRAGVVVVAAAGNWGPGESTIGSPAEAPDVLAVGASATGVDLPSITVTSPVNHPIAAARLGLSGNPPADGEDLDVVDVGKGNPSDYDGIDVTGKAVMFDYDYYNLSTLLLTAQQHGAKAAMLRTPNYYNQGGSQPGPMLPDFTAGLSDDPDKLTLVATQINGTDATDIAQWLASGPVHVHIGGTDATDLIGAFSSVGPTINYELKPDLVAPGIEIGSTWPGGGYADDTGTSMAAPHVAGGAALLLQAHPTWTPTQIAAALTSGSKLLPGYTATVQGAGRLDVAASDAMTLLPNKRIANLGLADMSGHSLRATTTVTLTNVSAKPQTLHLTGQPAPGTDVHVDVTPRSATVVAGKNVTVTLTVTGDMPAGDTDISGWLRASVTGAPTVTVPYLVAVRPLEVHASPDPTASGSTVYINSATGLVAAPKVTVTAPNHRDTMTGTAVFDHANWWRFTVPPAPAGTYVVAATAKTTSGDVTLRGQASFEELGTSHSSGVDGWQSIGPDSQGAVQIASTSKPGRMFAMVNPSTHAGLFRTDDSGATWHELRALPIGDGINMGLATDPTEPGTVYLAELGGGGAPDPTFQGRILVSHDAGTTWTTLPFPDVSMHNMSIDPTGRILTVPAYDNNVYVSTDRGETWTSYPSPGGDLQQARVIGHDLYIADGTSVYVVRNVDSTPGPVQQIFTSPADYQFVYDVVGDGHILLLRTFNQLFASRDGGATWQTSFTAPDDDQNISTLQIVNGDIYASTNAHLWVDRAEGTDWTTMPTPVDEDFFHVAAAGPGSSKLVVDAEGSGIYLTGDGGATYQRIGITAADVHTLAVGRNDQNQNTLVAGTTFSSFTTALPENEVADQATRDWGLNGSEAQLGGYTTAVATDPTNPHIMFRAIQNAQSRSSIDRSTDGGVTWDGVEGIRVSSRIYQIVVDAANHNYVYGAVADGISVGVVVSRDGGTTWRHNNLPTYVTAIAADPRNPNSIWLGGPDGLFHSDDQGQSVTRLSSTPVTAIAVDPKNPNHLIVGGAGLYDSRDGGHTLTAAATSGFRLDITSVQFGSNGQVYAGDGAAPDNSGLPVGGRGVLASRDGGRTWQNISDGMGNLDVACLALSPDAQWLYAGTIGGSVYRIRTRIASR